MQGVNLSALSFKTLVSGQDQDLVATIGSDGRLYALKESSAKGLRDDHMNVRKALCAALANIKLGPDGGSVNEGQIRNLLGLETDRKGKMKSSALRPLKLREIRRVFEELHLDVHASHAGNAHKGPKSRYVFTSKTDVCGWDIVEERSAANQNQANGKALSRIKEFCSELAPETQLRIEKAQGGYVTSCQKSMSKYDREDDKIKCESWYRGYARVLVTDWLAETNTVAGIDGFLDRGGIAPKDRAAYKDAFKLLFDDEWNYNFTLWDCVVTPCRMISRPEATPAAVTVEMEQNILAQVRQLVEVQAKVAERKDKVSKVPYEPIDPPAELCYQAPGGTMRSKCPVGAEDVGKLQEGHVFAQTPRMNTCPILSVINALSMTGSKSFEILRSAMTRHPDPHSPGQYYYEFPFIKDDGNPTRVTLANIKTVGDDRSSDFERAVFFALKESKLLRSDWPFGDTFELGCVFLLFGLDYPLPTGVGHIALKEKAPNQYVGKLSAADMLQLALKAAETIDQGKPCVMRLPGHFVAVKSVSFKDGKPVITVVDSNADPREYAVDQDYLNNLKTIVYNHQNDGIQVFG